MRRLRKNNDGKIYACFPRQGRIFIKIAKNSKPKLITSEKDITDLIAKLGLQAIEENPSETETDQGNPSGDERNQSQPLTYAQQMQAPKPQNNQQQRRQSNRNHKGNYVNYKR